MLISLLLISLFSSYDRETTNSYTLPATPNFDSILRVPSIIFSSFENRSKHSIQIDGKTPFLSSPEVPTQSTSLKENAAQEHLVGELPISRGCSLIQTIFNGMLFHSKHLHLTELSTIFIAIWSFSEVITYFTFGKWQQLM